MIRWLIRQTRYIVGKVFQHRGFRVFSYWGGDRWRTIDPMTAWRALENDEDFEPEMDFSLMEKDDVHDSDRQLAFERCRLGARRVFGVQEYDSRTGSGLTEQETENLVMSFYAFADALKKNISTSPTSPVSTESESLDPSPPTSEQPSTCTPPV